MCEVLSRSTVLRSWFAPVVICLFAIGPLPVSAAAPDAADARLILRLQDDVSAQPASAQGQDLETRLNGILRALYIQGVTFERGIDASVAVMRFAPSLSAEQIAEITDRLQRFPGLRYAEPDGRVTAAYVPSDPLVNLTRQWYHYESYGINAYAVWDLERGDPGMVIALLDTGILPHEDLDAARVLGGFDFVSDPSASNDGNGWDTDPADPGDAVVAGECEAGSPAEDSSWHGLHLAGVMLAHTDNGVGVAGINHVSRLLPVRVLGKCGGSFSDIIAAILWSAGLPVSGAPPNSNPAKVINLSFAGTGVCTPAVQDAIDRAVAAGSILVTAAGNGDGMNVANVLPAGCSNIITVAATDRTGSIASYSNLGSRVLLSAPGGDGLATNGIYSIYNTGTTVPVADDYDYLMGTSVAAAEVSAAVSLLLSTQPALTLNNVRQILSQTAQPYATSCPTSVPCGAGILDMHAALLMAQTITPGDPASVASSGGGGGGCSLRPAAATSVPDAAWLVSLLFFGLVRCRRQSMRV